MKDLRSVDVRSEPLGSLYQRTRIDRSCFQRSSQSSFHSVESDGYKRKQDRCRDGPAAPAYTRRSEEHTSELQSRGHLVCRLLLDKTTTRCRSGGSRIAMRATVARFRAARWE